jgi:cyclase
LAWIAEAERLGAGEIVLNCMDRDGTGDGYDLAQVAAARATVSVPLVASGGARWARHFPELFLATGADAALAAGALHRGELTVGEIKEALAVAGLEVRR